jgi:hypothetical protein
VSASSKAGLIIAILVGVLLLVALAATDRASAAPLTTTTYKSRAPYWCVQKCTLNVDRGGIYWTACKTTRCYSGLKRVWP